MPTNPIKLSPSDLTFLWDECSRCFYLKHIHGITRPAAPFPSVFGAIDRLMKAHYAGRPASEIVPSLPPGTISVSEKWIESVPVVMPGHSLSCFLRGKVDAMIDFEDGSHGIVDFKTSEPKPTQIPFLQPPTARLCLRLRAPRPRKVGAQSHLQDGPAGRSPTRHLDCNHGGNKLPLHFHLAGDTVL